VKIWQWVMIAATILVSWLGMMIVHETGHATVAVITGGHVQRVVLPVVGFSRTDVLPNPRPLAVAWGGPVVGEVLPAVGLAVATLLRWPAAYLLRFFTGFCFVANGAYIGAASFHQEGDAYPMLLFGSKPWQLWGFGIISAAIGLWLWNGLGEFFGLGPKARQVKKGHALGMAILLTAIVIGEGVVAVVTQR
jgi:hypothetical protein